MKGNILIYVDEYNVNEWHCNRHDDPDNFFWFERGLAVSDSKDRIVDRTDNKKIRRFIDYNEAYSYMEKQNTKYNGKLVFFLVYEIENKMHRVSTFLQIKSIDNEITFNKKHYNNSQKVEFPYFNNLSKQYGKKKSFILSRFIDKLDEGKDALLDQYTSSTYERFMQEIKDAGVLL